MSLTSLPKINLYNTLSRSIEELVPIQANHVRIYCCGPTVYNFQHIGNLRTYIFEDLLVRTLRYAGYNVNHVMNITDVGHLVSDADEGEDKMLVAVRRERKSSQEIAEYYTQIFFDHCDLLNIKQPNIICKATEHIKDMIALISRLEERGCAYQSGGNVYFDVSTLKDYGKLAKLDLSQLQAGARIEVDEGKRNPLDFALWFTKSKFENQELQWDSPWGRGYPGWHIECSAMAIRHLGEHFDIHCGGIDHIPVHHTNEIAQSEGATGKPFVNIWMHGGFLVTGKDKMSKSTGEFLTLDRIQDRGLDPISYRLLCLGGTYRNELAWSWEALESATNSLRKLKKAVMTWRAEAIADEAVVDLEITLSNPDTKDYSEPMLRLKLEFETAIFNDLGFPKALAVIHQLVADSNLSSLEKIRLFCDFDQVLGLGVATWKEEVFDIPQEIITLAEQRLAARAARDWKESDLLRDQILNLGYLIEDAANSYRLKKK